MMLYTAFERGLEWPRLRLTPIGYVACRGLATVPRVSQKRSSPPNRQSDRMRD